MGWWSRLPEYAMPLLGIAFAVLALAVGAVLSLVLWSFFGAKAPLMEEVGSLRLFHRSRLNKAVSPSQVWIKLEHTLLAGWVARAWLLGAVILALILAALLAARGHRPEGILVAAGGLLFLPALIVVWNMGRDVYLVADSGRGVLFRTVAYPFRIRPAEAFPLSGLRKISLHQDCLLYTSDAADE